MFRQLCAQLSAVDGAPLDPLPYLLNGSINVLTTFLLGVHYKLGDEKFQTVSKMTKDLLRNLMGYVQAKMTASITPRWLIKMRCFRKLKMRVFPKYRDMCELLYGKFQPYIFSYIKDHKKGLDEENFRDYMDFLLDLTRTDSSVGFHTIGFTLVSLYIGGTDTIANTMRWLLIQLALRPALQERLYDELQSVKSEKGSFEQKDCHLLSSVMLENRRCFPVADSLPHQVAEDVEIEGYRFKKGDFFLGSLASIMRNPENFENPDEFLPDRFIKDREFVHDYKVCSFGVGKRNCIGQQIAKTENFYFAAEIILNFTLEFEEGAPLPKIDKNMSSVLAPEPFKLKFLLREN